jgi:hypothetical protein
MDAAQSAGAGHLAFNPGKIHVYLPDSAKEKIIGVALHQKATHYNTD